MGDLDRRRLQSIASQAEHVLQREVNIERVSPAAWTAGDDPFVATLRSWPLVQLDVGKYGCAPLEAKFHAPASTGVTFTERRVRSS